MRLVGGEKAREVRGSKLVKGFVGEGQDFIGDPVGDREPVEVFEDWGNVMPGFGVGEESGCCILDQLEFVDGGVADAIEERVAVIKAGGDESVDE